MDKNKLFDDTPYIDRTVVTDYDKKKWKEAFQNYCDSDKIRKESDLTGLNACAKAMLQYFFETGRQVDYKNTDEKYLDKLLRGEYE